MNQKERKKLADEVIHAARDKGLKRNGKLAHVVGRVIGQDCCQECGTKQNLTIDHIVPLSRGGVNELKNLQVLCGKCNYKKGNLLTKEIMDGKNSTVVTSQMELEKLRSKNLLIELANPTNYDPVGVALELRDRFDAYKEKRNDLIQEVKECQAESARLRDDIVNLKKQISYRDNSLTLLYQTIKKSTNIKTLKRDLRDKLR